MFYLIHGTDREKIEQKFRQLLKTLLAKKDQPLFFRLDSDNFREESFEELIFGQSLFDRKYLVGCQGLLTEPLSGEFLLKHLPAVADSPHIFVFSETALSPTIAKEASRLATGSQNIDLAKTVKSRWSADQFILGDKLGQGDRRAAWVVLALALEAGAEPEVIYWQYVQTIKNMILVKRTKSIESIGLHPFVLTKTKKQAANFSEAKLISLHHDLVLIYHDARIGRRDLALALESFILSI
ncbi:MAG: hypothetical protein WDZ85_03060 [Candidatus Paceibacterota bacterium]